MLPESEQNFVLHIAARIFRGAEYLVLGVHAGQRARSPESRIFEKCVARQHSIRKITVVRARGPSSERAKRTLHAPNAPLHSTL